jgi:hypothetical protein
VALTVLRPDPRSIFRLPLIAAALVPPAAILFLILRLGVNVPVQDDWDTVTALAKWQEGSVTFADFWVQHNEHRIPSLRVVICLVGIFSGYNVVAEMLVGFLFAALALPVMVLLFRRSLMDVAPDLVLPLTGVASLLFFSLMLHENWFSGTASLQLFLLRLVSLTLVWVLVRWPGQRRAAILAACCATVGTFAEAAGLALWVTGALGIVLTTEQPVRRNRLLFGWAVVAAVTIAAYTIGLSWEMSDVQRASARGWRLFTFIAACLGLPFAYGKDAGISAATGTAGLIALATALLSLAPGHREVLRRLIPLVLVAVQGLLGAVLIGVGRSALEAKYAMASHYAFGSSQFWIATIAIVTVAFKVSVPSNPIVGVVRGAGAAVVGLMLCDGFVNANRFGLREARKDSRNLENALTTLYTTNEPPHEVARFLYPPDEAHFRRQLARLQRLRLGPFAPSMEPEKARLTVQHQDRGAAGFRDGVVDEGDCNRIAGWAWDPMQPDATVTVDVWYRGSKLGSASANWFRPDLEEVGIGDGQHGFVFYFPDVIELGTGRRIQVTTGGSRHPLRGSPAVVMCR